MRATRFCGNCVAVWITVFHACRAMSPGELVVVVVGYFALVGPLQVTPSEQRTAANLRCRNGRLYNTANFAPMEIAGDCL